MNPLFAALMIVSEEENSHLQGRTLFQKKVYFLSTLMKKDCEFHPHYYGPYSEKVADAIDKLVGADFLKEQTDVFPVMNVFGEGRKYSYTLTADGKELLDEVVAKNKDYDKWLGALRKINKMSISDDFNRLSIAAKMHYVLSEHERLTAKRIREEGSKLGWEINIKDIDKIAEDLIELGLIVEP